LKNGLVSKLEIYFTIPFFVLFLGHFFIDSAHLKITYNFTHF